MPTQKRHKFTMDDLLADEAARNRNIAPPEQRDSEIADSAGSVEGRIPITARIRADVRERLAMAVLQVQLYGCRGVTLKDVLEAALVPLLDDLEKRGEESVLVERLRSSEGAIIREAS